ncbi:MAG: hypothetical protein ACOZCF_03090 [Bacillota bacterium]
MDIFCGSLPEITVSDFEPVMERRVAMFFNAGIVSGRIRNSQEVELALSEITGMVTVTGYFTVCAIGRSSCVEYSNILSEVEFCPLPPQTIAFSRRLYSYDEEASVELSSTCRTSLELRGCHCEDGDGRK